MDSTRFEDRHSILDPEQRFGGVDLRQQKPCPAGFMRMRREEFGKGGAGRCRQAPALVQPAGETIDRGRPDLREDSSAGDQRQASCHTTHNVFVLSLFFSRDSSVQVNGATRWLPCHRAPDAPNPIPKFCTPLTREQI